MSVKLELLHKMPGYLGYCFYDERATYTIYAIVTFSVMRYLSYVTHTMILTTGCHSEAFQKYFLAAKIKPFEGIFGAHI